NVAVNVARRPILPGEEGEWLDRQRDLLRGILVRGLDCLAAFFLANGDATLSLQAAAEAVAAEPFYEAGYQHLMRAHAALGNRAEALRVYERFRKLLAEELGTDPAPQA